MRLGYHLHGLEGNISKVLDAGIYNFTILDLDRAWTVHILDHAATRGLLSKVHIHQRQWAFVTDDPVRKAQDAVQQYRELRAACLDSGWNWELINSNLRNSSTNEWSIESFGGNTPSPEGMLRIANYLWAWGSTCKSAEPEMLLAMAAESPGHGEDGPDNEPYTYGAIKQLGAERFYHTILIHSYWEPDGTGLTKGCYPCPWCKSGEMANWTTYRALRPPGHKHPQDPGGAYWMFPYHEFWISECNEVNAAGNPQWQENIRHFIEGWRTRGD